VTRVQWFIFLSWVKTQAPPVGAYSRASQINRKKGVLSQDALFYRPLLITYHLINTVIARISLIILLAVLASAAVRAECDLSLERTALKTLQRASVARVIDGDTIRLEDNRLIRLIGINTPEIDHESGQSEPLAKHARDALLDVISQSRNRIMLQVDEDLQDHHGRWLAHAYNLNGVNIQAVLLQRGLGYWIAIAPNLKNMPCYRKQEQIARDKGLGVWGLHYYQPQPVGDLTLNETGFRLVHGRIAAVHYSAQSIWLKFDTPDTGTNVALRIQKSDLNYFDGQYVRQMQNKTVTARGWLYPYKGQMVMRVHHPAAMHLE